MSVLEFLETLSESGSPDSIIGFVVAVRQKRLLFPGNNEEQALMCFAQDVAQYRPIENPDVASFALVFYQGRIDKFQEAYLCLPKSIMSVSPNSNARN